MTCPRPVGQNPRPHTVDYFRTGAIHYPLHDVYPFVAFRRENQVMTGASALSGSKCEREWQCTDLSQCFVYIAEDSFLSRQVA